MLFRSLDTGGLHFGLHVRDGLGSFGLDGGFGFGTCACRGGLGGGLHLGEQTGTFGGDFGLRLFEGPLPGDLHFSPRLFDRPSPLRLECRLRLGDRALARRLRRDLHLIERLGTFVFNGCLCFFEGPDAGNFGLGSGFFERPGPLRLERPLRLFERQGPRIFGRALHLLQRALALGLDRGLRLLEGPDAGTFELLLSGLDDPGPLGLERQTGLVYRSQPGHLGNSLRLSDGSLAR